MPAARSIWEVDNDGSVRRLDRDESPPGPACATCGAAFVPSKRSHARGVQRFCSLPCAGRMRTAVYLERRAARL